MAVPSSKNFQNLFFYFLLLSPLQIHSFPNSIVISVTKDVSTLQYTTQILIGKPLLPTTLVVDLAGKSLWLNCAPSPSRQFLRHRSLQCSMANSNSQRVDLETTTAAVCRIHQENPVTGAAMFGDLTEDIITFDDTNSISTVDRFLFACVAGDLLKGLPSGAKGMLGLGKSKISLPSQLARNFDFRRKFTLCLSSSDGVIVAGDGDGDGISRSLTYTPLVPTSSEKFYIHINSIKVNGKKIAINKQLIGATEISTVVPYTTMKTEIYEIFTKAYVRAAVSMNMTVVSPVAPFGLCFSSGDDVRKTESGQPVVPHIDLVLQSEMVRWRVQGRNAMVQVSDAVMCLGFLDGGMEMNSSIDLGGYQLEDHILEVNLGNSMVGFSSSLLMEGNSCSAIRASVLRSRVSM